MIGVQCFSALFFLTVMLLHIFKFLAGPLSCFLSIYTSTYETVVCSISVCSTVQLLISEGCKSCHMRL